MSRTWAEHVLPMFCACSFHGNSMNNLLSYCGLVDARISASEKDLPVGHEFMCQNLFYVIQLNPDQKGCHTKLGLKQRSPSMMLRINRTQGRQQLIRKLTTI